MKELYSAARQALAQTDPAEKIRQIRELAAAWRASAVQRAEDFPVETIEVPGRPDRPRLVAPRELVQRKLTTDVGRAALIHAVAHIEFNAMNLALDAVYRFRGLPTEYYGDWLSVAEDEARHFQMLTGRLAAMGYAYGDFPAHNGLWEMAVETAHDHMVRMALVPRVLEARGLDVTPGMLERLRGVGDAETVAILEVILREEIGHVAIGSRWFKYACAQRGLEPESTFRDLLRQYLRGRVIGPFNEEARLQAGFSREELAALERL